jgi:PAS domain S-box-containing protein
MLALGILVVAIGLRIGIDPWIGGRTLTHPTVFIAVLLAAWYCGMGPAMVNIALGYAGIDLIVLKIPTSELANHLVGRLALYLLLNIIILLFVRTLRRERTRLERTLAERNMAEQALKESEHRLLLSQEAAQIGVFDWNIQTGVNLWTQQLEAIYGLPPGGFARTQPAWEELVHPDDRDEAMRSVQAALQTGQPCGGEWRIVRPDGSERWISGRFQMFKDQAGKPQRLTGVNIDITERKRLEEHLKAAFISTERARATAEDANQAKDRFLATLSHELRTPLTPVLAAVQLMQRKTDFPPELRPQLDIIRRNLELEARLIDDLLDLTRIVHGKIILDLRPMNICTVIERVVDICRPDLEARRLEFGVKLEGAPHPVFGDEARLQQVLWNLLQNSIKFTPEGGRVEIGCYRRSGNVIIEVTDSGFGIEPEAIPRIFNAFEQEDPRVTRQFSGLGLGLAIAKRLVELHEGTISAQSEGRSKGALFRVTLPALSVEAVKEPMAGQEQAETKKVSRRILLVEDHGDTAEMIQLLLESAGHRVKTVGNADQALSATSAEEFDLLVSDLGLPGKSGLELMQELRRQGSTLKGIVVSGFGRGEDVIRSQEVGYSAHLTKPVDFDSLLRAVETVLPSKSAFRSQ